VPLSVSAPRALAALQIATGCTRPLDVAGGTSSSPCFRFDAQGRQGPPRAAADRTPTAARTTTSPVDRLVPAPGGGPLFAREGSSASSRSASDPARLPPYRTQNAAWARMRRRRHAAHRWRADHHDGHLRSRRMPRSHTWLNGRARTATARSRDMNRREISPARPSSWRGCSASLGARWGEAEHR
jgi:hypothetical protein